jgi:ribosome biogenesis GTPase
MDTVRGLVIRSQSSFYTVKTDQGELKARLRGRLKQGRPEGDIVALGDWVQVSPGAEGEPPMIEEVEERRGALLRQAPGGSGNYEQVIVANPDRVFLVFACADPEPRFGMLDRFLIITEQQDLPAAIVVSKVDLLGQRQAKHMFQHYTDIGYPVYYTSAESGLGVKELHQEMAGKITVLAGPSGVGKTTLLNRIEPGLGLRVAEVREKTRKGSHTTVERVMFPLQAGGYVADTPGLKALALSDIEPEELDGYFPEIAKRVPDCKFRSCTHTQEPGCAVLAAVEAGAIHPDRYKSYLGIRTQLEDALP